MLRSGVSQAWGCRTLAKGADLQGRPEPLVPAGVESPQENPAGTDTLPLLPPALDHSSFSTRTPAFILPGAPRLCGWAQTQSPLTQQAGQRSGAPVHHGAWHRPGGVSGSRGHGWAGCLVTKSFKWGPPRLGLGVSEKPQKPRAILPGGTGAREPRK